jgi:hypothetical protein
MDRSREQQHHHQQQQGGDLTRLTQTSTPKRGVQQAWVSTYSAVLNSRAKLCCLPNLARKYFKDIYSKKDCNHCKVVSEVPINDSMFASHFLNNISGPK